MVSEAGRQILGKRWDYGDMVVKRDRRKSIEHASRQARISHPAEIPGYRIGIWWGEQDRGREVE